MAKNTVGLQAIYYAPIPADGGVPLEAAWKEIGQTVIDSLSLTITDLERTPINIEESEDPIRNPVTGGGIYELTGSSYDVAVERLAEFLGGTVTGTGDAAVWNAPDRKPVIYLALRVISPDGYTITMPRTEFNATAVWNFQKGNAATLNYTATALKPTKADVAKVLVSNGTVVEG